MKRYRIARAAIHPRPRVVLAFALALLACPVGCGLAMPLPPGPHAAVLLLLSVAAVALFVSLLMYVHLGGRLDLGADGLFVACSGVRRYIAFAELSEATTYAEHQMKRRFVGVSLQLASGEQVKVPLGEDLAATEERLVELREAIRAALAAYRAHGHSDASAAALTRGGRSTDEWVRRLRVIGATESAGGHREVAVQREELWRVVEDPCADASARAGAAVALGGTLHGEERLRLRAVAETTASPRLRVAVEAAAAEDEGRTIAALENLA